MTIEDTARSFVGVRWVHQGRNPEHGMDCAGLGKLTLEAHGYDIKDRADYGPDPDGTLTDEIIRVLGPPIATNGRSIQPGDFVQMQFARNKPRHVGIIGSHQHGLTVIHACNKAGRVVEHLLDDRWLAHIVGVWRPA